MPDIQKILGSVTDGKYDEKSLLNLYRNTQKYDSISEEERTAVTDAVTQELWKSYPRAAKKLLGPLDARPRELLEQLFAVVSEQFDLSDNKLSNGVKLGGMKRSGEAVVDLYISYKDPGGDGVLAGVHQIGPEDSLVFKVFSFKGSSRRDVANYVEFTGEDPAFEPAYIELLTSILVPYDGMLKAA